MVHMSDSAQESNRFFAESLQQDIRTRLADAGFGVTEERHYSGSRLGDEHIDIVRHEQGIEPVSNNLMNVYPLEPSESWEAYQAQAQQIMDIVRAVAQERGALHGSTPPKPEYDSENRNAPGDLRMATIDVLEHPLPSLYSLTTYVLHPSRDVAERFVQMAYADDDVLDAIEFLLGAGEFAFVLPEAPASLKEAAQPPQRRGRIKALAGWLRNVLQLFSEN